MEKPDPVFRLTNLSTERVEESPTDTSRFCDNNLMERVISIINDTEQCSIGIEHEPYESVWLNDSVVMPFEIDEQNDGILRLTKPRIDPSITNQVETYEDLAQLLGVAISTRRAKAALLERVKELTCMYRIAHISAEPNVELDDMLQEMVELLPVALQYPNLATARITLGLDTFCSTGFSVGPCRLSAEVIGRGETRGEVEVFYRETASHTFDDVQLMMEDPFLAEEQHLVVGVARELNSIVEHKQAEGEKLQLQEQVRRSDRLVTIGQLAAGVAHELNEPLGNILGFAQLAIKSPDLTNQTKRDIEKIEKASLYAREIIRKLMFFSRQTPSHKIDVSLQEVIEDGLSLLETRCDTAGVILVRNPGTTLPLIHGDPSQLQQVLVNLVVNAIQSMPEGGTVTVSTQQQGNKQCMIIEDTGVGIAPEDIKNVFLPFFTTKDIGEGTGLGLSVVHGIISSHGGQVGVESVVGKGTRFEVQLPTPVSDAPEGDGDEK